MQTISYQVLLCNDKIGWRNETTHIVVMITNAGQHIAGDGLEAGIWRQYPHECKLDSLNRYDGIQYDYPSLSEVNYWLQRTETTLIVGTIDYYLSLYQKMIDEHVLVRAVVGNMDDGIIHQI